MEPRISVNEPPAFSWKISASGGAVRRFVFRSWSGPQRSWDFTTQVELLTSGYVRVRLDGIYLVERKFQSGDREVRLAGMMHVAIREFYSGLLRDRSGSPIGRACGRGH